MKTQLKKSIKAALSLNSTKRLECGGGDEIFIKKATIAEIAKIEAVAASGERVAEKTIALILCDEHGNLIFDADKIADLDEIAEMVTADFVKNAQAEFLAFNGFQAAEEKKQ